MISELRSWWQKRWAPAPLPRYSTLSILPIPGQTDLRPIRETEDMLDACLGWVFAAVSTLAWDVRSNAWAIWNRTGSDRDDWEEIPAESWPREAASILTRPNTDQLWEDLLELTEMHLGLTGQAFWLRLTDPNGRLTGYQVLYPHWIRKPLLADDGRSILEWQVQIPGREPQRIPSDQVIWIRYPHPKDPLRAMSPVEAFALSYDLDMYSRAYGSALLRNNSVPPIALISDNEDLTIEQADAVREAWKDRYENRPGEPAVLRKGVSIEKIGFPIKDLDFLALARLSREQIFAIYKLPPSRFGIREDSGLGKADAEVHERNYQKYGLLPRLRRLESVINAHVIPDLWGPGSRRVWYEFESPVESDEKWELEKAERILKSGSMLVNDFLGQLGFDPKPDGDVYLVPSSVVRVPAGDLDKPPVQPPPVVGPSASRAGTHLFEPRGELAELAELRFLSRQDRLERAMKSVVRARFSAEQKAVKAVIPKLFERAKGAAVETRDALDEVLREQFDEWFSAVREFIQKGLEAGWSLFEEEFDKALSFEIFEPKAKAYAAQVAGIKVKEITETTLRDLRSMLSKAIEEGWSVDKITAKVVETYEEYKGLRAQVIARTETATSVNTGKFQAADETARRLGLRLEKRWVATQDERTRPSHAAVNGETLDMSARFRVGSASLAYPGEVGGPAAEVIQCRCTLAYSEKED